jgi:nucleoid DNA-binding protein
MNPGDLKGIDSMQKGSVAPTRKTTAVREQFTKTQLLGTLAENTGLAKKDVASVLEELSAVMERHLKKRAVGQFTLPGLLKVKTVKKPATKARKMISPFTGEEITVAAKPARTSVKILPLKGLKVMVE